MALDADRWRTRGHHVRAMESVGGVSHAHSRESMDKVIRVALVAVLRDLPPGERDAAVALAVEGYIAEHVARGGTVTAG